MPNRTVIRATKLGGQFAGHIRQHARRVADSASEPFPDQLPSGAEVLDLEQYQIAIGGELDRRHEELTAIDNQHLRQLERERQLREQRDRQAVALRERLLQIKDGAEGHFGRGAARALFQEDPAVVPTDPVALYQVGERVFDSLTDPNFDLEPTQPGVQVDPLVLASSFGPQLLELGATLRALDDSRSLTRHTQSLKDAAVVETEAYDGNVARYLEAFYTLAGHPRLASRLRRSSHVRPPADEPDSDGDAEPADGGESAASAEDGESAAETEEAAS